MKRIRLTESDLNNIVKSVIRQTVNETYPHIIKQQFGMTANPGSFESAIIKAWKVADPSNKKKLEQTWPNIFPSSLMYGNEEEPFDFREFPTYNHYDEHMKGWKQRHP